MKDAQKPDHISLNNLIGRLDEGRFVIPDFQREFEWKPWDIRDLLRSIFLDYYIGSLLLWKGKNENFKALSCEPIYGAKPEATPEYIVLDGQQRLTAMYYAFLAPNINLPSRSNRYFFSIRINRFMAEEYDLAFEYDWSKRWTQLIEDRPTQYAEHIFPLSVVGHGSFKFFKWIEGYQQFWRDAAALAKQEQREDEVKQAALHADNAMKFGEYVQGIAEGYQISYIELDVQLEIDKVCDIFTQINSKGVQLDTFDLMNAMLKPKDLQLKKMWREASPRLEFVETDKMDVYILQVMSILRQGYCSPKYQYFLLPGQEKAVRDPDGTRRKEILVTDTADFKKTLEYRSRCHRSGNQAVAPPAGVWRDFVQLPALRFHPSCFCCASVARQVAAPQSSTGCTAKKSSLVLGVRLSQSLLRFRGIHGCRRFP